MNSTFRRIEPLPKKDYSTAEIVKGKLDTKQYKYLLLPNLMQVLLVSQPKAETAAIAINVEVGSYQNYPDFQGIAHFMEHMIFLGNSRFPKEDDYLNFIAKNGGRRNGSTATQSTKYFCTVAGTHFEEALERMSEFFITPLFSESCTERELKAIDSEYNNGLSSDEKKMLAVFRTEANEKSCVHSFGSGNYKSLKKEGLREALLKFYNEYYSSNLMNLVVFSKESLEGMEASVSKYFMKIQNKNVKVNDNNVMPYEYFKTGILFKFISTSEKPVMVVKFLCPSCMDYTNLKSAIIRPLFCSHISNSLYDVLLHEDLINGINASFSESKNLYADLSVTMSLTAKGMENYKIVIQYLYAFINFLKDNEIPDYLLEGIKEIHSYEFNYSESRDPFVEIQNTLDTLQKMNPNTVKDVLWAYKYSLKGINKQSVKDVFKYLTPENSITFLSSNKYTVSDCPLQDLWGYTYYSKICMSLEEINNLKAIKTINNCKFCFSPQNIYLPTNFELIKELPEKQTPVIIMKKKGIELWHYQYSDFKTPKAFLTLEIYGNMMHNQTERLLSFQIFIEMYKLHEIDFLELTSDAGVDASCALGDLNKVEFNFDGFSDRFHITLLEYLKRLLNYDPSQDEAIFNLFKQLKIQNIMNLLKSKPSVLAQTMIEWYIKICGPSYPERLEALKSLTFARFLEMCKENLQMNGYMICIIGGNLSQKNAVLIMNDIEQCFKIAPISSLHSIPLSRSIQYDGEYYTVIPTYNKKDSNSIIYSMFQPSIEFSDRLRGSLLNMMLIKIMNPSAFEFFRTKCQLGYIASAVAVEYNGIANIVIRIQSHEYAPEFLYGKIAEFIGLIKSELKEYKEDKLNEIMQSVQQVIKDPCRSSTAYDCEIYKEILRHRLLFDYRNTALQTLATIKLSDVIEYFDNMFINHMKRLDLEILCDAHIQKQEEYQKQNQAKYPKRIRIDSYQEVLSSMSLYPNQTHYFTVENKQLLESLYKPITN